MSNLTAILLGLLVVVCIGVVTGRWTAHRIERMYLEAAAAQRRRYRR